MLCGCQDGASNRSTHPVLLREIHTAGATTKESSQLHPALVQRLHEGAEVRFPTLEQVVVAADGTRKYLVRLLDGSRVESVLIPTFERMTLCVSSQTGCGLNCAFCATAQQKPCRNLNAAEIIGQLWLVNQALRTVGKKVTNVVFMGMGEPLLNREAVFEAIEIMRDDYAYALGRHKITVSTVGYIPGILAMANLTDVGLTVSLHAPEDSLRDELVPINKKYPLASVMEACRHYLLQRPQGETVTFAYTLLRGVNDSSRQGHLLANLIRQLPAKVNLIPFNYYRGTVFQRSAPEVVETFRKILLEYDIVTIIRRSRGDDIAAACGQLSAQANFIPSLRMKGIEMQVEGI